MFTQIFLEHLTYSRHQDLLAQAERARQLRDARPNPERSLVRQLHTLTDRVKARAKQVRPAI